MDTTATRSLKTDVKIDSTTFWTFLFVEMKPWSCHVYPVAVTGTPADEKRKEVEGLYGKVDHVLVGSGSNCIIMSHSRQVRTGLETLTVAPSRWPPRTTSSLVLYSNPPQTGSARLKQLILNPRDIIIPSRTSTISYSFCLNTEISWITLDA